MVRDAEAHADEDKRKKELVEARNQAENLVYSTEKSLNEHGEKVDDETRRDIESARSRPPAGARGRRRRRDPAQGWRRCARPRTSSPSWSTSRPAGAGRQGTGAADDDRSRKEIVEDEVIDEDAGDRA